MILSLFFDDFRVGDKFTSRPRKVTREEIHKFADLTGDRNRLHIDMEYARQTDFGSTIAHGMLTLSFALGLWYDQNLTRDSIIAFMGINNLKFQAPIYPDDEIRLDSLVIGKRESQSRTKAGLITFRDQIFNQEDKVALLYERVLMLKIRPSVS